MLSCAPQMRFVRTRMMQFQEYPLGGESAGLRAFRRLLPPFIHVDVIQPGSPEYDDLSVRSVVIDASENFTNNVSEFISRLIEDEMGQGTKDFYVSKAADVINPGVDGRKLGIPLLKAMIAEMVEESDSDLLGGVTKVYLIHPPHLESELLGHFANLPVPARADSASERLISVPGRSGMHPFVVHPYKMDLTRRRSTDPRWLIVHLYNPDKPALAIKVESQGPFTFKEPTPLLSNTEVAEDWAMSVMRGHFRDNDVDIQGVSHEPNGPKTFPDYQAQLNGTPWDFEITRVLGNILRARHIFDEARDARSVMLKAVQSPPIKEEDIRAALDHAIESKRRERSVDGIANRLCLILLNPLGLEIGGELNVWDGRDLTSFDAVILVGGYPHPNTELIAGEFKTN